MPQPSLSKALGAWHIPYDEYDATDTEYTCHAPFRLGQRQPVCAENLREPSNRVAARLDDGAHAIRSFLMA